MIGYVTLGTNDLARGAKFYDAIGAELGVGRMMEGPTFIAWGKLGGGAGIGLTRPHDGNQACIGNGVMVALDPTDPGQVDCLHAIALANGGTDASTRLHSLTVAPTKARRASAISATPRTFAIRMGTSSTHS